MYYCKYCGQRALVEGNACGHCGHRFFASKKMEGVYIKDMQKLKSWSPHYDVQFGLRLTRKQVVYALLIMLLPQILLACLPNLGPNILSTLLVSLGAVLLFYPFWRMKFKRYIRFDAVKEVLTYHEDEKEIFSLNYQQIRQLLIHKDKGHIYFIVNDKRVDITEFHNLEGLTNFIFLYANKHDIYHKDIS